MNQNDLDKIDGQIFDLQQKRQGVKNTLFLDSSKDWFKMIRLNFESSSQHTPEYLKFHRLFKKQFTKTLKEIGADVIKFSKPNHFDASGFFQMGSGEIFYFSLSDLRWDKDFLLVREANNFNDYSGGTNQFCNMKEDYERFIGDLNYICTGSRRGF